MLEVKSSSDLRQQIITRVIEMKNGTEKCTPQPDAARGELAYFVALLPWLDLNAGVRDALKGQQ
jgi:hypothetical protein